MKVSTYPDSRVVASTVQERFARHIAAARLQGQQDLAPQPDALTIEATINAAFWASLLREESYSPKISIALLPPEQAGQPLMFERLLAFTPGAIATRIAWRRYCFDRCNRVEMDSRAYRNMKFKEQFVQRDRRRIYAREYAGAEPAIVLMHGFPDNLHLYDRLLPYLSPPRRIVTFDILGWGSSDKPLSYP